MPARDTVRQYFSRAQLSRSSPHAEDAGVELSTSQRMAAVAKSGRVPWQRPELDTSEGSPLRPHSAYVQRVRRAVVGVRPGTAGSPPRQLVRQAVEHEVAHDLPELAGEPHEAPTAHGLRMARVEAALRQRSRLFSAKRRTVASAAGKRGRQWGGLGGVNRSREVDVPMRSIATATAAALAAAPVPGQSRASSFFARMTQ